MAAPWLSVVMPVFNGAKTLPDTLNSLIGQCNGIEIIALDQASSDGSREILEGFRDRLDLRIIPVPDGESWMQNSNVGIAKARAALVTMLHQDDLWLPGRAQALLHFVERFKDATIWVHAANFINDRNETIGHFSPAFGAKPQCFDSSEVLPRMLVQNTFPLPAVMFTREAALAAGGLDENLWYTADWDLWLKLANRGKLAWLPETHAAFRIHANSLTMTGSRNSETFGRQLAIPVERHIGTLSPERATRVRALAEASNALNIGLARSYHGGKRGLWKVFFQILRLGPLGWHTFFRDTKIVQRLLPRVKLKLNNRLG